MKKKRKWVILIYPPNDPQWVPMLRGIADYAEEYTDWNLQYYPEIFYSGLGLLKDWPGHGIIGSFFTKAEVSEVKALGLPVVNISGALRDAGLPRVMVDQEAIGRLAAEHLIDCKLSHFAYYGERNMWYSEQRKQGFSKRLAAAGFSCSVLESAIASHRGNPWREKLHPLDQWLCNLPKPVGLFAVQDYAAVAIIHLCGQLNLRVPDDVAVLGVGNDLSMCNYFDVSSVARNRRVAGYETAKLLDALMSGKPPPEGDVLVPPEGVVQRRSTEIVATEDPCLSAAVQYVRDHAREPFTVNELCRKLCISRRALEVSFREVLGTSPRDYIVNTRIQHAKKLLTNGRDLKLEYVARASGFYTAQAFYVAFRRNVGSTPSEYRRRMREERF